MKFNCLCLGTGTSVGVPMIGCDCAVCRSSNPHNNRRRTSLYVTCGETCILIDTPPDFRDQALAFALRHIDAVLFTHAHADHIFGFDDIRRFNTMQAAVIPAYAGPQTIAILKRVFGYISAAPVPGHYRPQITFHSVTTPFMLGKARINPVAVEHGDAETVGYRIDYGGASLGYVPDCHSMAESAIQTFSGVDVMILDGLRNRPHKTHLTICESIGLLQRINARRSYLIHLCHEVDHDALEATLPEGIKVTYDGLYIDLAETQERGFRRICG